MRNLQEIIPAFFVGPGGQRLTPEQIAAREEVARSLMAQATDTRPDAGGWASVAAKGLMGLTAGRNRNAAERAATANAEANSSLSSALLGSLIGPSTSSSGGGWSGMAPTADVATSPSVASALVQSPQMVENQPPVPGLQPSGEGGASYIRQGLIARGLPEHIADAFIVNFQDESGLNPGINEKNPIVPGSRGGFGLYQLTGPRRVAYEQYAAERGVPVDDIDAQLDFMMGELQGSEARAAQSILAAPDTATAAQAIVRDFLRPSPEYRDSRMAKYAALPTQGGSIGAVNTMAQGGQSASAPAYVDPMVSAPNSRVAPVPSMEVAQALAPQPNAGYFPPAPQVGGLDPAVIQALSDPTVSPENKQIAMSLVNQYQARQQAAQEQAQAQALRQQELQQRQAIAQQYGIDPALVPVDEAWKLALEPAIKGKEPMPLMNLGDGTVYDPNLPADQRFIRDPSRQQTVPDSIRALDLRAERAGLQPGTPEYNQFMLTEGKAAGMQLRVGPDGTVEFSESGGLRPLTEAQSKDNVFMTRAQNAVPLINAYEDRLLSLGESAAGALPGGMGNYLQSEEYQLARDAGREFLATILRKDTGAAVTASEEKMYGDMFLPRPGDKPKTVAAKRQRRALAVEAIGTGMSISQLERVAKAIDAVEPSTAVVDKPSPTEDPLPPQRVTSKDQFDRLPSGTRFVDPQGNVRIKP